MEAKLKSGAKRATSHKQQMPTLTPSSLMARETRHPQKAETATAQEPNPRGNKRSLSKRARKHRLSVRDLGEKGRAGSGTRKCLGRSPGSPKLSKADAFSPHGSNARLGDAPIWAMAAHPVNNCGVRLSACRGKRVFSCQLAHSCGTVRDSHPSSLLINEV